MSAAYEVHGHAIVSDDDRIADAHGDMPDALKNAADWQRFQDALAGAAVIVLGRKGHAAHANIHRRNRMVVSTSARGIERHADAWWWNPAEVTLAEALAASAPGGGRVVVPGGRRVYDLFLVYGFDEFHLARARGVLLPGGVPVFTECSPIRPADEVLASRGLVPEPVEILDAGAGVSLTVWKRHRPRVELRDAKPKG
jgi:dihydrofolate reductase